MTQTQQITNFLQSINQLNQIDPGIVFMLGLIGVIVLVVVLFGLFVLFRSVSDFSEELRQLNMDIARSMDKEERRYYRYLRLRLWLSWLPFFRD